MNMKAKVIIIVMTMLAVTACASQSLDAPCPNFGEYCARTPINSWHVGD